MSEYTLKIVDKFAFFYPFEQFKTVLRAADRATSEEFLIVEANGSVRFAHNRQSDNYAINVRIPQNKSSKALSDSIDAVARLILGYNNEHLGNLGNEARLLAETILENVAEYKNEEPMTALAIADSYTLEVDDETFIVKHLYRNSSLDEIAFEIEGEIIHRHHRYINLMRRSIQSHQVLIRELGNAIRKKRKK